MTVYVSSMILRSLRMIGEKIRGDTLTTAEQTECLEELNSFMDSCALDRLLCYQVLQESFALTTNTVSYTIGVGADFNTVRPTRLVDPCFTRDSSGIDSAIQIINGDSYGKIVQKSVGTTYPNKLFYDQGYDSSGYGTIKIYPAPIGSLTLFINSWKQIGTFSTISMAVSLPPGYQRFIESNFAIEQATGFTNVSPELVRIAKESRALVKGVNLPDTVSRLDTSLAGGNRSNIITGP